MSNRLLKREKHTVLERELRALGRRQKELWHDRFVTIEFEKPQFWGYRKYFVLREDISGRPDFSIIERLFPLIENELLSKTKKFIHSGFGMANLKLKGKKMVELDHKTKDLKAHEWEKLPLRDKAYFFQTSEKSCGANGCKLITVYRWLYPWMLVSKIQKHYITSLKIKDITTQSELALIDKYIEQRGLDGKMRKIIYGFNRYGRWKATSELYSIKEKQVWKDIRNDSEIWDPSVYAPLEADFSVKKLKPSHSEKNHSAFLFLKNALKSIGTYLTQKNKQFELTKYSVSNSISNIY